MKRTVERLENGLRVVLVERPRLERAAVVFLVGAGSRCDPAEGPGTAHLVEHLLFRSPTPGAGKPALRAVFDRGGDTNGETGLAWTRYSASVHHWDLSLALEAVAATVCDLPDELRVLELEKAIVQEEMSLRGESSDIDVETVLFRSLFANPEFQHSPAGTRRAVRGMRMGDVRAFYGKWYRAGNAVLSVVGRFDRDAVLTVVNDLFGRLPPGAAEPPRAVRIRRGQQLRLQRVSGGLSLVAFSFPSMTLQSRQLCHLDILASVFCQGPQSRLFRALREEMGWAYLVTGQPNNAGDFGLLEVLSTTHRRNARRMVDRIFGEAEAVAGNGIPSEEFEAARERCIRAALLLSDDPLGSAAWYAERELLSSRENADCLGDYVEELRSAELERANRVATAVLSPARCCVYVMAGLWPWSRFLLRRSARRFARNAAARENQ